MVFYKKYKHQKTYNQSKNGSRSPTDPNRIRPRSQDAFLRVASPIKSLDSAVWIRMGSSQLWVSRFLAYQSTVKSTKEIHARPDRSQLDPYWRQRQDGHLIHIDGTLDFNSRHRRSIPFGSSNCSRPEPRVSHRLSKTNGRPRNSESATANN